MERSATFSYRFTVPKEAIDFNGHVGNVTYLQWMIEAATAHSESVGWGFEACKEAGGTWVAKSHHIEYRHPAFENDTLLMKTWLEPIGKIKAVRRYEIVRETDETLICEGVTEWIFVDIKSMRPMRIPRHIVESFA